MRNYLKEPLKECCEKSFEGALKDIVDLPIQDSESAARQAARAVSSSNAFHLQVSCANKMFSACDTEDWATFKLSERTHLSLNVTQKHGRSHQCNV